jgi:myo-inositol 2-dehydrogenase/D-chiro-inositol 1-dehydrogenase
MHQVKKDDKDNDQSRREFLRTSTLVTTGTALGSMAIPAGAHVAGSDVIKIGLIGCGGRGTDAAINAMNAGKDVRLVAMADLFQERLDASRDRLQKAKPDQCDVPGDRCFLGFDAYEKVIASGIDAVLIAPASHFSPSMMQTAVTAGKHVFCEKPHGIDVPGLKMVISACEEARSKGLSVVSGLCWRYDPGVRETIKRVHDGAIGPIVAIEENYVSRPYVVRDRRPGQSELEYQLWNWYHFNWLSGDQTAQQLVHSLDKASWALGDKPPVRAWGMGGRQTCLDPRFGDQFDHQAVVFEYDNSVRVFAFTRDQEECYTDTSDLLIGTKGRCDVLKHTIEGQTNWRYSGPRANMYDVEHKELFDSIRSGKPINNGNYMCLSTALGIMAQIACYTGGLVSWDEMMRSRRSFVLPKYDWNVEPPIKPGPDGRYPSALQGTTERKLWLM